ncbi:DUF6452 family protein [Flavobacterium soli]|uniref:DUF6452 family protein n=1 Tax=Flavobacterium soli TaxID=344881 RepID=UPI00047E724D|nr:DUF6452 family protein [Flavobacterium soli]
MKKILCVLFIVGIVLAGCEKDDICDPSTPTTPRLVIKFYDFNNPSVVKRMNNLKIVGEGMNYNNGVLNNNGSQFWNDTVAYIPLKINEDVSKFRFIRFAQDTLLANATIDTLAFNYSRRDEYVSRACGFKTNFDLFGIPNASPFVLNNDDAATSGNWIENIEVIEPNLDNENETHINIYFL